MLPNTLGLVLAAVVLAVVALCPITQGSYTTAVGGCYQPSYPSLTISSAAENAAAARYLHEHNLASAGLGGYVSNGQPTWDDGSAMVWSPPSLSLPPKSVGFLILRSDGSWSYLADRLYLLTTFICWDGLPEEETTSTSTTTTTTTTSQAPTSSSSLIPEPNLTSSSGSAHSTTSGSSPSSSSSGILSSGAAASSSSASTSGKPDVPSTPPTSNIPVDLASVVAALKSAFDAAASINVLVYTANVVQLSAAAASLSLERLAKNYGTVYLGVGGCDANERKAARVAALVASPSTAKVGFYLPYDLVTSDKTTTYNLCLLGYDSPVSSSSSMPPPTHYALLSATLTVRSVSEAVSTLQGSVTVNYEDRMDGKAHTKPLVITGSGTATPYTTALSPEAFAGVELSLINNGVNGRSCTPSSNAIPFLLADNTLQLSLSSALIQVINNGEKSVCASLDNSNAVVVAKLSEVGLAAVAPNQKYTYGTAIPVRLRGVSTNSLAKGLVTAFLAKSAQCATSGAVTALVEVSLSSDIKTSSAAASATFVPQLFITAPTSAAGSVQYVCLSYKSGSGGSSAATTFKLFTSASVATSSQVQVSVTGSAKVDVPTTLTVFNGMEGTVMLGKYVADVSSEGDQANHDAVVALVASRSTQFVSFVPLHVTASTTRQEKTAACRRTGAAEVKMELKAGALTLTQYTQLAEASGVLCIGAEYIRIDYTVVDPTAWLKTFGGTSDYASSAFVLSMTPSTGSVSDAAPITFTGSEYHSDIAIRLSSSGGCTNGNAALVRKSGDGKFLVGLPSTGLGMYTICVGLYTLDDGVEHAAFASTTQHLSMAPFDIALSNWKAYRGISSGTWTSCGGSAVCGTKTTQFGQQVCPLTAPVLDESGSGAVVRTWPSRLEDEVNYVGAFTVQMGGNGALVPGGAFLGGVFTSPTNAKAHCQQYSLLEMSTDGASYSTSVVATMNRPFVSFKADSQLSGSVFGLVPWDQDCSTGPIQLRTILSDSLFLSDSAKGETGNSTFDISSLLYANKEGYYLVCYTAGGSSSDWKPVTLSYVKVVRDRLNDGVQVEAIGTGNPADNQDQILLWRTQSTTWYVVGEFDASVSVSFRLVWDDATCQSAPSSAYTTPVLFISTTGGKVAIDTSLIADPPADGLAHYLYPCYTTALSKRAKPLSFEMRRNRRIVLSALALASLNYLPHYSIAYNTLEDTSIQLTDPRRPPVTRVALFRATSLADPDETTAHCSMTSQNVVETLSTSVDRFGMRWLVVPSWVPRVVGNAEREVYLLLCATASTAASPQFEPVAAYITVNQVGVDSVNDVYLDLTFATLNLSTDVLDSAGAAKALSGYATAVLPAVQESQVLVSDMGFNHFAVYVEPGTLSDTTDAVSPTASLYAQLVAGTKLPLEAQSTVNASYFVLKSVEGRRLGTQSVHPEYPFAQLRTSSQATTITNGATISIALFCIIVTPTVVGFVIFSVQRTIPTLRRGENKDDDTSGKDAAGGSKGPTVYPETGDSPLPRNPRTDIPIEVSDDNATTAKRAASGEATGSSARDTATTVTKPASQMELTVEPNTEDTAANPLYDDSDDEVGAGPTGRALGLDGKDLGSSPPLRNTTFAMSSGRVPDSPPVNLKDEGSANEGSEDDLR